MLSSVLRSEQAVRVNIEIMRAFVRMRLILETHREWARKLEELEKKVGSHDEALRLIFDALKRLMAPEVKEKRRIGFKEKGEQ
jgi:chromosome condensin MukBEF ATPase and DNA-binding subunit MukB